jgi:hypothetical protein
MKHGYPCHATSTSTATPLARWVVGACAAVLAVSVAATAHAEPVAAERARIEALLTTLANDTVHQFERSGTRYTGAQAARFLRAKWEAKGGHIQTAEQFVERIASRSTTTGQTYRVCTGADACVPAGEHLRAVLKGL